MRRLSALSGAGMAGLLPTRVLSAAGDETISTSDFSIAATSAPDASILGLTPPPAPPPVLWDGASGVSKEFFNYGARLPWLNIGGDWSDAAQVPQGSSGYATIAFAAAGPATATITPLVQRWYTNGNTGAYLKCTANAAYVATRANSTAALRPVVALTLSDSTTVKLICSAESVPEALYTAGPAGETASVEFARTVSRLTEMQSTHYLQAERPKH